MVLVAGHVPDRFANKGDYFLFKVGDDPFIIRPATTPNHQRRSTPSAGIAGSLICTELNGRGRPPDLRPTHAGPYGLDGGVARRRALVPAIFSKKTRPCPPAGHVRVFLSVSFFINLRTPENRSTSMHRFADLCRPPWTHCFDAKNSPGFESLSPPRPTGSFIVENPSSCYHSVRASPDFFVQSAGKSPSIASGRPQFRPGPTGVENTCPTLQGLGNGPRSNPRAPPPHNRHRVTDATTSSPSAPPSCTNHRKATESETQDGRPASIGGWSSVWDSTKAAM